MAPDAGLPRRCDAAADPACPIGCSTCTRLRSALRAMLVDRSWDDLTESAVARAAGMDVIVFLEHYPSVAACGVAAVDEAAADCHRACAAAFAAWRTCPERFFGMSDTVLTWMQAQPAMARLLFVVPEQSHDAGLLERLGAFKRRLAALFDEPGHCTPAGRTHVEFVIGLFCQAAYQQLVEGAEPESLRSKILALAPFVEAPPPLAPSGS